MFEVENGAGLVVGELFEEDGGFIAFVKDARGAVAWEPGIEAGQGVRDAFVDARCFGWVCLVEGGQAFAEARCILVGNGEHTDATLGAAGSTDEVGSASMICVGNSGIYDLYKGRHG